MWSTICFQAMSLLEIEKSFNINQNFKICVYTNEQRHQGVACFGQAKVSLQYSLSLSLSYTHTHAQKVSFNIEKTGIDQQQSQPNRGAPIEKSKREKEL